MDKQLLLNCMKNIQDILDNSEKTSNEKYNYIVGNLQIMKIEVELEGRE